MAPERGGGDLQATTRASSGWAWSSRRAEELDAASRTRSACTSSRSRTRRASTCGPKVEAYEGGITFVVLRTARYVDEREEVEFGEVSIFVGPGFIITVRQGVAVGPARRAPAARGSTRSCSRRGRPSVLWAILDKIVDDYAPVVEGPRDATSRRSSTPSSPARTRPPTASTCCAARSPTSTAPCTRCSARRPRSPRAACSRSRTACASTSATSTTTSSSSTRRSSPSATC